MAAATKYAVKLGEGGNLRVSRIQIGYFSAVSFPKICRMASTAKPPRSAGSGQLLRAASMNLSICSPWLNAAHCLARIFVREWPQKSEPAPEGGPGGQRDQCRNVLLSFAPSQGFRRVRPVKQCRRRPCASMILAMCWTGNGAGAESA